MVKFISKEEYYSAPTLYGLEKSKLDYQRYENQIKWNDYVRRLKSAMRRGKTSSSQYSNSMSEYISLCEEFNLPNVFQD